MSAINKHLIISSFLNPLANRSDLNTLAIGKLESKYVEILAHQLNFTYEVHPPKDLLSFGYLENGSWTGTMGQLQRKEVDMCVTAGEMTFKKYRWIDYSHYIRSDDLVIVMAYPNGTSKAKAVIAAFSSEVWIGLIFSYIVVIFCLWFFSRASNNPTRETLGDWFIYFMSAISKQGYFTTQNSHAFRIICSTLCLTAVVIMNSYIARYTSDLTVKHYNFQVSSIEEAASNPHIAVHLIKGTTADDFIMNSNSSYLNTIKNRVLSCPRLRHNFQELNNLEDIVHGNNVILMPRSAAIARLQENYQRTKQCRFVMARKSFYSANYAMAFPKGSSLAFSINKEVLRMHETGLLNYAGRRSYSPHDPCSKRKTNSKERKRTLQLTDLIGAFYILLSGIIISLGGFVYDYIVFRVTTRRRRRLNTVESILAFPPSIPPENVIQETTEPPSSGLNSISLRSVPIQSAPDSQLTVEVSIESSIPIGSITVESDIDLID